MQRQHVFCAWCGVRNPKTSHWHIGEKRFCSGGHYRLFAERDIEEKTYELEGVSLPRFTSTRMHGRSPRPR